MYFITVWTATFLAFWKLSRSRWSAGIAGGYDMAVTQAFTAASNNVKDLVPFPSYAAVL
jgi:ACR3 family arsenite transporter